MSNATTRAGKTGEWQTLLTALTANQDDLTELESNRARLETALGQIEQLAGRQAAHAASKQEATKALNELMTECQRLTTLLRMGLKQHYGIRSEKLTEFGVQPFRGRQRNGLDEETNPEAPAAG
jgi:septal ring factor EnvC (AmiA/AmiB activator)